MAVWMHFALLATLPPWSFGFLLETGSSTSLTSQALASQLGNIESLNDAVRVLGMLVQVINLHETEANRMMGTIRSLEDEARRQRQMLEDLSSTQTSPTPSPSPMSLAGNGGATYVRWGRSVCPGDAELVYAGYMGGKRYNETGSGSNNLCLPDHPQFFSYISRDSKYWAAYVYGTEYEISDVPNFHSDHNAPCAVCRLPNRETALMIPARTECYPGFVKEYGGYLMTDAHVYHSSEYACVDSAPESIPGNVRDDDDHLLYVTRSKCSSLPCPPYIDERELPCVVCSK